MKSNEMNKTIGPHTSIALACRAMYGSLVERIRSARAAILSEFRDKVEEHEHLLELAMNEAEALAWQTGVPQLVFPTLAMEKAQTAARWHTHQRSVQHLDSRLA